MLTCNWAASCIWVSPSALRWVLMVRPISFASISAVREPLVLALLSLVYDFIVAEREDLCNRRTVEVVHAPWNCNFFGFIPRFFFT